MTSNLDRLVKSYFTIEEEMKVYSKKLSELRPKKLAYSEQILEYIEKTNTDSITSGDKTIKLVKNKKKVFKRKNIEESIKENVKDQTIQNTIFRDAVTEEEKNYLKVM